MTFGTSGAWNLRLFAPLELFPFGIWSLLTLEPLLYLSHFDNWTLLEFGTFALLEFGPLVLLSLGPFGVLSLWYLWPFDTFGIWVLLAFGPFGIWAFRLLSPFPFWHLGPLAFVTPLPPPPLITLFSTFSSYFSEAICTIVELVNY